MHRACDCSTMMVVGELNQIEGRRTWAPSRAPISREQPDWPNWQGFFWARVIPARPSLADRLVLLFESKTNGEWLNLSRCVRAFALFFFWALGVSSRAVKRDNSLAYRCYRGNNALKSKHGRIREKESESISIDRGSIQMGRRAGEGTNRTVLYRDH